MDDNEPRETMTLEAIEREHMKAVTLDLPEHASIELLRAVDDIAWSVKENAEESAAAAVSPDERKQWETLAGNADARSGEAHEKLVEALENAAAFVDPAKAESTAEVARAPVGAVGDTAAEADAVRIRDGEDASEVAAWQPVRGFLSFLGAAANLASHTARKAHTLVDAFLGTAENLASHAARAVDIALGAVIGYFVDEPKMTAAQVHQTLQAAGNVETIHAREVEAAAAVDAAEHETRMLAMKGEQQTHDLTLAVQLGTNATAEATIGLDAYEPQRRKQSQSL